MKLAMAVAGVAALAAAADPEWEVVSIRPCVPLPRGTPPQRLLSPGRLHASCWTPISFIQIAYDAHPNPLAGREDPVSGGPVWIRSDRYDIEAKAEGNPSAEMMQGAILQAILGDRFKLK